MSTHRLQFDVSENAFQEFEKLREELGFEKKQELFRAAIRYLQWTWERVAAGEEIQLVKGNAAKKVKLPYLPNGRRTDER